MGKSKIIPVLLWLPVIVLAFLNLVLVFMPELGFDALWYHLTLPKLWLLKHQWYFPGGLLYYSVMPRLSETIFIPLVQLTGTIGPKMVQYLCGIGTGYLIWKILDDLKQTRTIRALGVSLFYCTWLVSWQSGSAYIDLIRTFLETTALYFLIKGSWKMGGLFLGLAVGTKWLALVSLAIYSLVFGFKLLFPAILIASPWFAIAYYFTGNPIFPIFSGILHNNFNSLGSIVRSVFLAPFHFTKPFDDFISPLAGLVFLVAILASRIKNKIIVKVALVGIFGSLASLTLDPPSSRFFLPYFPALIIASVVYLGSIKNSTIRNIGILLGVVSGFFILGLRIYATKKYVPLIIGEIDHTEFLVSQSHRLPDTFIDSDNFVGSLPPGSRILVDKLHNLYYFPRDFDHTSWTNDPSGYDFLVTIGENPASVSGELIHQNKVGIQIFKLIK